MAEFLQDNWFWILLVVAFIGMHSFGGGCCGGGRHRREKVDTGKEAKEGEEKSCH